MKASDARYERIALPSSETKLEGIHCALAIRQFQNGVVTLTISGTDIGEFGERPMLALKEHIASQDQVKLFIDARDVRGASISVSGDWAAWLNAQKDCFRSISMLTGSRYVEVTAGFVRRFASLEGMMTIYTAPAAFDCALEKSLLENGGEETIAGVASRHPLH